MSNGFEVVACCPSCFEPTIKYDLIVDRADCLACQWHGTTKELVVAPAGDREYVDSRLKEMGADFHKAFASGFSRPMAVFFQKWGFFGGFEHDQPAMVRIVAALTKRMALAAFGALMEGYLEQRVQMARQAQMEALIKKSGGNA